MEKFHLKKKWREKEDMGDLKCGIERLSNESDFVMSIEVIIMVNP